MVLQTSRFIEAPQVTWEKLPDDYILPDDPVDNINQPALAAALTEMLSLAGKLSQNALVSTNYGYCATINGKLAIKAPDWAYVPEIKVAREEVLRSYTPQLQGSLPLVVMEFLSDSEGGEYSIKPTYPPGKWYFYEQILRVPYYVLFEPDSGGLECYRLNETGHYAPQTVNAEGRYDIPEMQLSLGVWEGRHTERVGYWLRWWDSAGQLLLWGDEKIEQEKQRFEQEKQRADLLADKLRELGIDLDTL
jgi:Uma2 family endonuclease